MIQGPLPFVFEDRTGSNTSSDFDDIYDRLFFRVARAQSRTTTMIYDMDRRASRHRDTLPFTRGPSVVLEFMPDESLGTVSFVHQAQLSAQCPGTCGRRPSLAGAVPVASNASLSRKFHGSDGREYKWDHHSVQGQEWTCTSGADNQLVAHYNLKPPGVRAYDVSGHTLTVYEDFSYLALEILASLTIMRHIALHNL
ncbi:hypothetical protein BD779DRAFT_1610850 [Infundibulicybe gibba]|nr:hypothetical protein BD779DRAFT_1610850 [Infundibulicybe gibba]